MVCSDNDYLIVEGTVENFEGDAAKEILEVSRVKFNYEWNYIGLGYNVLREEGGVLQEMVEGKDWLCQVSIE